MKNRDILISGAGIAGLTLAYWLKNYGFNPTVVEKNSAMNEGGYMVDFWGSGFEVAEKMNLKAQLEKEHSNIPELVFVNKSNKKTGGFNVFKLRKLMNFRHLNLLRGGLAKVLYHTIKNDVEFIWDNPIKNIEPTDGHVAVQFQNGEDRKYDLVIGADGLHSVVRKLIFGGEEQFERYLGYYAAAFTLDNYIKNDASFYCYSVPGKQVSIYGVGENKLATLFIFSHKDKIQYDHSKPEEAKTILRTQFENAGWECRNLLSKMADAPDFYFDTVSQMILNKWSKGRIALIGDACHCVSLVAGAGASLAMAAGYTLAGELRESDGDFEKAFANYQLIMEPEVLKKQKMGLKFAGSFIPKGNLGIWARDKFSNLMFLPFVSKWFIKQYISDSLKLKIY